MAGPAPVTRASLADDLRRLGVEPGAALVPHVSMRRTGPVEGGADALLDALEDVLGPTGTLVVVAYPEEEADGTIDLERSPAAEDLGAFAEVARTRPGTRCQPHPDARFAVRGALADHLLAEPLPWDDPYGPGSLLDRFAAAGGQVLRLAPDPGTTTLLHLAEHLADVPDKRTVTRTYRLRTPAGVEEVVVHALDDGDGIVEWDGPDYFGLVVDAHLAAGRGRTGRVGNADAELLDGADLLAFATAWMTEHLGRRTPLSGA